MGRDTEFPKATQLLGDKDLVLQSSIFYMEPEFSSLVLLSKAMKIMILFAQYPYTLTYSILHDCAKSDSIF